MKVDKLTAERAREALRYDGETGNLFWAVKTARQTRVGAEAGCVLRGYRNVQIDGVLYRSHRVVWLIAHGEWPSGEIDHIDGDRLNNRISNLRDLPVGVNQQNRRQAQRNSSTGLLGTSMNGDRFQATISVRGKSINLGRFDTAQEAHEAYLAGKRRMHPACTI